MKIFPIYDYDEFNIFINKYELEKYNMLNEDDAEKLLKKLFLKIQEGINEDLNGTYYVEILQNDKIGAFISIEKKSNSFISKEIELKTNILFNSEVYFETEDFYAIKKYKDIYYYNNKYYISVDKIDNVDKYSDFGVFIPFNKIKKENFKKIS